MNTGTTASRFAAPSRRRRAATVVRQATLALCLPLMTWSCSPPVSGIYADASGATQYEFRTDGKVYISVLGATASGDYEADGDRVLITGPQGTVLLLRKQDRLQGPMGLELRPQPSTDAATARPTSH